MYTLGYSCNSLDINDRIEEHFLIISNLTNIWVFSCLVGS